MKRRLFLKTGSVGIGGMIAMPTVIYGCATMQPIIPIGPNPVSLFTEASRLFDFSIVTLRIAGSGELASAESEDPLLSGGGTTTEDLMHLAQQVASGESVVPAEVAEDFAESAAELLESASELSKSAPDLLPLGKGLQAELADDYALLKVVKASTLLASAAAETPQPMQKVHAAQKMISSAEIVHKAVRAGAESELIEGTGELLAFSEEYVGSCQIYTAEPAFLDGVATFEGSIDELVKGKDLTKGASDLMTSTDNISLSAEHYATGVENLNAEAEFFGLSGSDLITSAVEFIPAAELLNITTPRFLAEAESESGEAAILGAEKMVEASAELLKDSIHVAEDLGIGGAWLDLGADQFIGGEIINRGDTKYSAESVIFNSEAQDFINDGTAEAEAEAEFIHDSSEILYAESKVFFSGAEILQKIKHTEGVDSLIPAAQEILEGAKLVQSEAESNSKAEVSGSKLMVIGAKTALKGAKLSENFSEDFLEGGAHLIEIGTNTMMNGAAKFIEGYK